MRVLYVKPQITKKAKADPPENLTYKRQILDPKKAKLGANQLTDRSIGTGLFDVSGLFKRKTVTEAERRQEAKRAYSAKVRQDHKGKLKKPQVSAQQNVGQD